jgi:DNA-binding NarL/FixJ family response regulator
MITVAVVEDDARILRTVQDVLKSAGDCRCVAAFSNGLSAAERLPGLSPDVVLMDINLPDISGVECVVRVAPLLPNTEIIMLTVFQDPETIFQALTAGAHGYLIKPVMPARLLQAIREIRDGGVPMSPSIARNVIQYFRRVGFVPTSGETLSKDAPSPPEPAVEDTDNLTTLGARELQVIEALVDGYSYKEIAVKLNISIWTVATYVRRIYKKLHVSSRREIIAKAGNGRILPK